MIKKILAFIIVLLPVIVFAKVSGEQATLINPLGDSNKTIFDLVTKLLKLAAEIGAIVCVFFIIYSGFLFVKAQGKPEEIEKAKTVFFWSVIGTAVLLGATAVADIIKGTVSSVTGQNFK